MEAPSTSLVIRFMRAVGDAIDADVDYRSLTPRQVSHLLRKVADTFHADGAVARKVRTVCWNCGRASEGPDDLTRARCQCGAPEPFWN